MARKVDAYKDDYQRFFGVRRKCNGVLEVKDTRVRKDFKDTVNLVLYKGECKMGPTEVKCLIKKDTKVESATFPHYCMMRNIRHYGIVEHLNIYAESKQLRVVLSWVDESLTGWLQGESVKECFSSSSKASFTPIFRKMIVDISNTLEYLFDHDLYPTKIDSKNMFLLKVGKKRLVKLMIREGEVQQISDKKLGKARAKILWVELRRAIESICQHCNQTLHSITARFVKFIAEGRGALQLEGYPDVWTFDDKASYLAILIGTDKAYITKKLKKAGICWPKDMHEIYRAVIKNQQSRPQPSFYNTTDPFDYVRLLRVIMKHFGSLRQKVQELEYSCKDRAMFLERVEKKNPELWCNLYDAVDLTKDGAALSRSLQLPNCPTT